MVKRAISPGMNPQRYGSGVFQRTKHAKGKGEGLNFTAPHRLYGLVLKGQSAAMHIRTDSPPAPPVGEGRREHRHMNKSIWQLSAASKWERVYTSTFLPFSGEQRMGLFFPAGRFGCRREGLDFTAPRGLCKVVPLLGRGGREYKGKGQDLGALLQTSPHRGCGTGFKGRNQSPRGQALGVWIVKCFRGIKRAVTKGCHQFIPRSLDNGRSWHRGGSGKGKGERQGKGQGFPALAWSATLLHLLRTGYAQDTDVLGGAAGNTALGTHVLAGG